MKITFYELEALADTIMYWLDILNEKEGLQEAELYRKFHLAHLLKTIGKKLIDYEPGDRRATRSFNWKLSKVEIFTILRSYDQMLSIDNKTLRAFIFRLDKAAPGLATPGHSGRHGAPRYLKYDLIGK